MINSVIVWLIFVAVVAVLCFSKPNAGRLFFGLFFLAFANTKFVTRYILLYCLLRSKECVGPSFQEKSKTIFNLCTCILLPVS